MRVLHRQLAVLLLFSIVLLASSFNIHKPKTTCFHRDTMLCTHADNDGWDRRSVVESMVAGAMTLATPIQPASAILPYDLGCLLDLPALNDDCVRIYLCRHAQTENNRLRKVQGARVDPPINYNGIQQSLRLGSAFSRLKDACPPVILHSPLVRAKETAEYAARNIVDRTVQLNAMETLAEVDFGPVADGQPISDARGGMIRTYGAWAAGYVDARPEGGGESGRELLNRSATALQALVKEAEANGGTVAAIAHSRFLKVLLALVQDIPLTQAAATQQVNGCIDVIDMKRNSTFITHGPKSNLFGGNFSNAPNDFELQVPAGKVMRINEKRHLEDLEFETMVG